MKKLIVFLILITGFNSFGQEIVKKKKKNPNSDSAIQVYLTDADSQYNENYTFKPLENEVKKPCNWNYKRTLIGCSIAFVGGVANGYHETITYHYSKFKAIHPNANDQFWDPKISWLNKYENYRLYGEKEKYFGSTTFLAWTTDAKHLLSVSSNTSILGATCIITIGEKRKWWEYAIDIAAISLARSAGFHMIYSGIYK